MSMLLEQKDYVPDGAGSVRSVEILISSALSFLGHP